MKLTKKQKASLSLSINAVVILVLAIAMLGLGLGFTKRMFSKFGEKLYIPDPDYPATADDPIVLYANEFYVDSNKDTYLSVNAYCNSASCAGAPVWTCDCDDGDVDQVITGAAQAGQLGTYKTFKFIVGAPDVVNLKSGATCICDITYDSKTKQVTVYVK